MPSNILTSHRMKSNTSPLRRGSEGISFVSSTLFLLKGLPCLIATIKTMIPVACALQTASVWDGNQICLHVSTRITLSSAPTLSRRTEALESRLR